MKVRMLHNFGLVLLLALTPFIWGCQERAVSATVNDTITEATNGQPPPPDMAVVENDTNAPASADSDADAGLENAEGKLLSTPDGVSTNTSNNPQLADFVKLVQAGVGESVLIAYVTNSPTAFNLSSDDIVYLNDLGAPETVVTAMLQRDQYFNGTAATPPVTTSAPPVEATAPLAQAQQQPPVPDANAMVQTPPLTPSADVEAAVQQAPNGSYSYFYDSLAPYGNWIDIAGYGPCWQPTVVVVNSGWQPYCDRGHWAYTDCGWCWVSDYSWGWAPFHYGRWFRHSRFGWCWAPDTTWGPSWVSWRYSDAYCGWAPLPPAACYRPGFGFTYYGRAVGFNFTFGLHANRFTFVSMNHFHDRNPGRFRVEHREVTKIYNTTVINNTYIRGNNNTVINRGVPVDRVSRATHTDIRPIRIRADATSPRSPQLGRDGRSLNVFRPDLPKPKAGAPPRLVGEGVQAAPHFDLHSRVQRNKPAEHNPVAASAPERRPIISSPSANRPNDNVNRDSRNSGNNRENRFSQPNTEKPGSIIMRGPNRSDRETPSRDGNAGQTPVVRRGAESTQQQPDRPGRGDNNGRIVTPPLRPQEPGASRNNLPPTFNRPDNNNNPQRDNGNRQRQLLQQQRQQEQQDQQMQRQQNQQIQRQQQIQQQQQRDIVPRQQRQRDFQPIPRQEAPTRFFDNPRGNSTPDFRPQPRQEPVAPPRTFESRPEPRSAPPQYSAPSRPDNGGGQRGGGNAVFGGGNRGGGGGGNGNGNGNGNGDGRRNR